MARQPCFIYGTQNILSLVRSMSDNELAEVALRISELDPELFARVVTKNANLVFVINGISVVIDSVDLAHINSFHDKVMAIKWMRERWGLGLKDSKDLSELLAKYHHVIRPHWIPHSLSF